MHALVKHITSCFGIVLLSLFFTIVGTQSIADQSAEEIIKGRKALFSKNYSTAKRVQALSSNGDFDRAKELMIEMSENYKTLLGLFPENTKEGFKTESLPIIWEEKDAFNALMQKVDITFENHMFCNQGTHSWNKSLIPTGAVL